MGLVTMRSVSDYGTPAKLFGAGKTVIMGRGSWSVDVDVIFKEPQDASWQQGVLYYSAFVRPLDGNPFNR